MSKPREVKITVSIDEKSLETLKQIVAMTRLDPCHWPAKSVKKRKSRCR